MTKNQKPNKKPEKPTHDSQSLVKFYYGLYQCLYHLSNLTGGTKTDKQPLFSYKVRELDHMFLPAMAAWTDYWDRCHETNELWRKKQIENLVHHYNYCIGSITCHLRTLGPSAISAADLSQARKWAKQSYKKKFRNFIFDKVDQMVQNLFKIKKTPVTKKKVASNTEQGSPSSDRKETPAVKEAASGSSNEKTQESVASGAGSASTPSRRKRSASSLEPSSPQSAQGAPKRSSNDCTEVNEVTASGSTSTPLKRKRRASESKAHSPQSAPTTPKRSKATTFAEKVKSPKQNSNVEIPKQKSKAGNTPATVMNFPRLNKNQRGAGMHDVWEIPKVIRNILILGDSNLSRVSNHKRSDTQVASYSGLNLLRLVELFKAFKYGPFSDTPGQKPSHVVLNVGLNDRKCKFSTIEVSLRKMILAAKATFPDSKISIYQQPFDSRLKQVERSGLLALNNAIADICKTHDCNCIPALPTKKFKVAESDNLIHWSDTCANDTMDHFFKHLN